ncbi:MAG TPA: mechanosensitive ion channel domain-containing protein [Candidatus Deferrimicrobiaceae bacterium]|nr:mechanosensitive ion channel domain-containing protein [Candidatus Deferrimicrobiaceae bacterium]
MIDLANLRDILGYVLWRIGATDVTVSSLLVLAATIVLFLVAARLFGRALHALLLGRTDIGPGGAFAVARISQYAIAAVGLLISFQLIGLDTSSLALVLGALGIGIGFGLQNVTSNFISGLLILFERPITVGDRVQVGAIEGDVTAINMRATTILSVTNLSIIVPNSEFVTSTVVNYSHGDSRLIVNVDVGVSYRSDLDTVIRSLLEVAAEHPRVLRDPPPEVRFLEFGDSAWQMQLRVWIPVARDHPVIRSDLNKAIARKFRANSVEIPYPQRDLNWRSPTPIPVQTGSASEESEPA